MKVEINVDETQLKDILDKELKDLPKETIQDVIVQSIKGYFEQNNMRMFRSYLCMRIRVIILGTLR